MSLSLLGAAAVFTTVHIAVTAAISGVLALIAAATLAGDRRPRALFDSVSIGLLTAAAVFLWRKSANMPQLNNDGLSPFSANDWLAPILTFVVLGVYRNVKPPTDQIRFGRALAGATIIAFAINVITI